MLSLSTLFPRADQPGFGRFVERQFAALAERGDIDLTVISPIARPLLAGTVHCDETRGYPVHYLPFATIPRYGGRWNPALIARAALPLVRKLHTAAPFDLIDAQFFYPDGPAAARIAAELGLPLSIKARGSDIHYWGAQGYALKAMLAAADAAGGLLAVSEALKADMAALGMPSAKIAVHYTGLDHTRFFQRPQQHGRDAIAAIMLAPRDGPLLITPGNLIPLKGQALVIEALAELPDVRLLIAGSGPDLGRLKARAGQLGLGERFHFATLNPAQMALALSAADALVLPSEREGLANVWIEALACGTPLVITDVGGAREVVTSPAAGRLVERNPKAIAEAVRELLADPPARGIVAAHAERFSWEANAAQLAEHYRKLTEA